jgi:macrolide phosphotransferase
VTEANDVSMNDLPSFAPLESLAAIVDAARREGLMLVNDGAHFDESGLDFLAVHARDEMGVSWIVRSPRRMAVVQAARIEARVLALLRTRLPVAIPDWHLNTDQVIAYPRLDGVPAVVMDPEKGVVWNCIDPAAPSAVFIDSFARAIAALQAVDMHSIEHAGIPTKSIKDAREQHAQAMDVTRTVLSPSDIVWARWHAWLENDTIWPNHLALVHGDLHAGHLLLDEHGRLTGILDWTEAHLGDPSIDFALFFGAFGKTALDECITHFESAGGKTWPGLAQHAAERWAAFPALAAKWGLDTNNDGVIEYARHMLNGLGT